MPYIKQEERGPILNEVCVPKLNSAGVLNYFLTYAIQQYVFQHGRSYQTFCEIEGVLSHISKELYRRVVAQYEDKKVIENGEVYII